MLQLCIIPFVSHQRTVFCKNFLHFGMVLDLVINIAGHKPLHLQGNCIQFGIGIGFCHVKGNIFYKIGGMIYYPWQRIILPCMIKALFIQGIVAPLPLTDG